MVRVWGFEFEPGESPEEILVRYQPIPSKETPSCSSKVAGSSIDFQERFFSLKGASVGVAMNSHPDVSVALPFFDASCAWQVACWL